MSAPPPGHTGPDHLGAAGAVLLGVSYLAVAVTFFIEPLRGDFLFALGAACAFAAVPAISRAAGFRRADWQAWVTRLAYLGFAAVALRNTSTLSLPSDSAAYENPGLDDLGWLTFGAVGVWLLAVNLAALRSRAWPRMLAWAGLGAALAYLAAPTIDTVELALPATRPALERVEFGIAIAGGLVLGPAWYIGLGLRLWRGSRP